MNTIASIALLSLMAPQVGGQEVPSAPTPVPVPSLASSPAQEAKGPEVKVAGVDVPAPTRRKYVPPEYPAAAAAEGIRGIVILEVLISEDGKVESTKVTRSIPGLDQAAMNAVKLWEYEPTRVAGKTVKVRLSQSITFALKLPVLERAPGIPELKSGGAPPVPQGLTTAETASVMVALGPQGEVLEAAVVEGNPVVSEALLRAVRAWRFTMGEGAPPLIFTVQADWTPGPPPVLTLKATNPKAIAQSSAPAPPPAPTTTAATSAQAPPVAPQATAPAPSGAPPSMAPPSSATPSAQAPADAPPVDTEVLPAREEPPAKEEGISAVAEVVLGENIPDLVKGRRPVWPPLARLGNATGEVVVRFSVDLAGRVTVHSAEGPDLLKPSAEQAVATWTFRRTAIDRLNLIATFKFGADRTFAKVDRAH